MMVLKGDDEFEDPHSSVRRSDISISDSVERENVNLMNRGERSIMGTPQSFKLHGETYMSQCYDNSSSNPHHYPNHHQQS